MLDQYAVQRSILNTLSSLLSEVHTPNPPEVSCSNHAGGLMDLIIPNIPYSHLVYLMSDTGHSLVYTPRTTVYNICQKKKKKKGTNHENADRTQQQFT